MKGALVWMVPWVFLGGCNPAPASRPVGEPQPAKLPLRTGDRIRFEAGSPQLARLRVAEVQVKEVALEQVVAPGTVEVDPSRVSRVALPVSGRIREVRVLLGDSVRQGDTILTLESAEISEVQSTLRQAEANVSQAAALLAKAEADRDRARDLLANRAIAQKEVLSAETAVAQARAALEQALALRDEAQRKMRLFGLQGSAEPVIAVRAPISGKVIEVAAVGGEFRSDTAAPVLTIADLSTIWVSADVPESQIRFIHLGERVSITLPAFPEHVFTGRVKRIGDLVDPETRTIKVRAEMSNPHGHLRPGMFAQIRHDHGTRKLPTVPKAAVLQQEGRAVVYVERGPGEFQEVTVTVGPEGASGVAVTSGLRPGDRVVIEGAMLLKGALL